MEKRLGGKPLLWPVRAQTMLLKPKHEKTMYRCSSASPIRVHTRYYRLISHWFENNTAMETIVYLLVMSPVLIQSPTHMWSHQLNVDHTTSATACHLTTCVTHAKSVASAGVENDKFDLLMHKLEESSLWYPPTTLKFINKLQVRGGKVWVFFCNLLFTAPSNTCLL